MITTVSCCCRYIQVETAYFWSWWNQQDEDTRDLVRELVQTGKFLAPVVGVLDESYSSLSGVAIQARVHRLESCSSYVAWRAGMAGLAESGSSKTPASGFCSLVSLVP
jgi:hypothetical protein